MISHIRYLLHVIEYRPKPIHIFITIIQFRKTIVTIIFDFNNNFYLYYFILHIIFIIKYNLKDIYILTFRCKNYYLNLHNVHFN